MSLKFTVSGKGSVEFGVLSLPNRKSKALYRIRGAMVEILAYFRSDEDAEAFKKDLDFIGGDKYMDAPRDELLAFACNMERKLRENDHKVGWEHLNDKWLLCRIRQELAELEKVIKCNGNVVDEAADVANFIMMIADNHKRKLEEDDDEEWE